MSGQPDEQELHHLFRLLLLVFDQIESGRWKLPFALPKAVEDWYSGPGIAPWLDNYSRSFIDLLESVYARAEDVLGVPLALLLARTGNDNLEKLKQFERIWWLFDATSEAKTVQEAAKLKLLPAFMEIRCAFTKLICQIKFRTPIDDFIVRARTGDCEAITTLVKLDAAFLDL